MLDERITEAERLSATSSHLAIDLRWNNNRRLLLLLKDVGLNNTCVSFNGEDAVAV